MNQQTGQPLARPNQSSVNLHGLLGPADLGQPCVAHLARDAHWAARYRRMGQFITLTSSCLSAQLAHRRPPTGRLTRKRVSGARQTRLARVNGIPIAAGGSVYHRLLVRQYKLILGGQHELIGAAGRARPVRPGERLARLAADSGRQLRSSLPAGSGVRAAIREPVDGVWPACLIEPRPPGVVRDAAAPLPAGQRARCRLIAPTFLPRRRAIAHFLPRAESPATGGAT